MRPAPTAAVDAQFFTYLFKAAIAQVVKQIFAAAIFRVLKTVRHHARIRQVPQVHIFGI